MDDFRYAKEAIMCNHQINAFHCQQRWIKHKGGHWQVPEEYIARTVVCQKAPKATSNSEILKPVALAIIELCWSEGIRQLVS